MSIRAPSAIVATPAVPRSAPPVAPSANRGDSFGDRVARARATTQSTAHTTAPTHAPPTHPAAGHATSNLLVDTSRQLLTRVARGERYIESVVRQGLAGRAYTPTDLLAMQAQVYRYTQELELVSKLAERGTSTVKTILQQNG